MVRHFLIYIHSPRVPIQVRVPLIVETSTKFLITFYTWIPIPTGSYTIFSSLYSLEDFNIQLTSMNLSTYLNNGSNTTQG